MKTSITSLIILLSFSVFSQNKNSSDKQSVKMDTIKTYNKVIVCEIKEIGDENIKFMYPNEDILVSLNKNMIEKISFSSGRVQSFSESTNFKTVIGWEDWEKVSSTIISDEVDGLFKLGDVSSKAKGGTSLSNMNKIKDKAVRKLKIRAAMIGANLIFLTSDHTEGHRISVFGGLSGTPESMLTAIGYTNRIPDVKIFNEIISKKTVFNLTEIVDMPFNKKTPDSKRIKEKTIDLSKYEIKGDFIKINYDENEYTIIYLSNDKIILMREDKRRTYNYILE